MALGGDDNLDELWPTRWAERFDQLASVAYPKRQFGHASWDYRLAATVADHVGGMSGGVLIHSHVHRAFRACESPIERALLAALVLEVAAGAFKCALWSPGLIRERRCFVRLPEFTWSRSARKACDGWLDGPVQLRVLLYPQLKLGPYRADIFAVFEDCVGGVTQLRRTMAIECDGHDYHERTKQQASADKARDRYMQAHGHLVFRFSGADIWRDPIGCAREALGTLTKGVV